MFKSCGLSLQISPGESLLMVYIGKTFVTIADLSKRSICTQPTQPTGHCRNVCVSSTTISGIFRKRSIGWFIRFIWSDAKCFRFYCWNNSKFG